MKWRFKQPPWTDEIQDEIGIQLGYHLGFFMARKSPNWMDVSKIAGKIIQLHKCICGICEVLWVS